MQTSVVPQTKIEKMRRIKRFLLASFAAITLIGCSGSGGSNAKKGIALAKVNWNAGDGVVFVDVDGNRIIDSKQFSSSRKFSEGLCAVVDKDTRLMGFINEKGELVIPCQFPNPSSYVGFRNVEPRERGVFHCGYARMGNTDGCVLIDRKGNTVLEGFVAVDWDGDVAVVSKDDMRMQGLYTMDGKEIVPIGTYNIIKFLDEENLCCIKYGVYSIIDKTGKVIIEDKKEAKDYAYEHKVNGVKDFSDGLSYVRGEDEWQIVDAQGTVLGTLDKRLREWQLGSFCAERSVIEEKRVVDKNGNVVEIPGVTEISDFYYSGVDNSELDEAF